jgi:hypothetical protein
VFVREGVGLRVVVFTGVLVMVGVKVSVGVLLGVIVGEGVIEGVGVDVGSNLPSAKNSHSSGTYSRGRSIIFRQSCSASSPRFRSSKTIALQ